MSYSLNHSGVPVTRGPWKTSSGAKGEWYIYRVADLFVFLRQKFGPPDRTITQPTEQKFRGVKGLIVFEVESWSDASGHATFWNGVSCSDQCYFPQASKASIWLLE